MLFNVAIQSWCHLLLSMWKLSICSQAVLLQLWLTIYVISYILTNPASRVRGSRVGKEVYERIQNVLWIIMLYNVPSQSTFHAWQNTLKGCTRKASSLSDMTVVLSNLETRLGRYWLVEIQVTILYVRYIHNTGTFVKQHSTVHLSHWENPWPHFTTPYVTCDSSGDRWAITWQDNIHYNWAQLLPRPTKSIEKQDIVTIRLPNVITICFRTDLYNFHGENNVPDAAQQ